MSSMSLFGFGDAARVVVVVGGREHETRIPLRSAWATLVVLHPFEDDGGAPLPWTQGEKDRELDRVLEPHSQGRHAPTPGELDVAQASALLRTVLEEGEGVTLAFSTGVAVTPSSMVTRRFRGEEGAIDPSTIDIQCLRGDGYVVVDLCRDVDGLMEALDDGAGGVEWPTLAWSESRRWMSDSHPDFPFTVVSGEPDVISAVGACPALDLLPQSS